MIGNVLTWDIISKPGHQYAPLNYIKLFKTHSDDRDDFGVFSAGEAEEQDPGEFKEYSKEKLIPQNFPTALKLLEDITNVKEIKGKYDLYGIDTVKRHKLLKEFSEDVHLASKMWEFAKDVSIEEIKEDISGFTWNGRESIIHASIRMNGVKMYLEKIDL